MIVENTLNVQPKDIIRPLIDMEAITRGEEFRVMSQCLEAMKDNKTNKQVLHNACIELAKSLKVCFGIDVTISIVSPVDSLAFYGYNIFPGQRCLDAIIEKIVSDKSTTIREIWLTNKVWHIDIDGRLLYDLSNKFTPAEMTTLLLYCIEQTCLDALTPVKIAYTIMKHRSSMNYVSMIVADSERLRDVYRIPFMVGCADTDFVFANKKRMEILIRDSIVAQNSTILEHYKRAVGKILATYGNADIVDRSDNQWDSEIIYILNWIYEGLNDLRYSSLRLKTNLERYVAACRSPYVRLVIKKLLLSFSNVGGKGTFGPPGTLDDVIENTYVNPELKALREKMVVDYWKNFVTTIESKVITEFTDKNGNFRKIEASEIDMLRIEAENIESVNDKLYLMEKLYRIMGAIDTALELLETKQGKKVKQTKAQLERLRDDAKEVRQYILRFQIQPERYGLYVKYPAGYQG